MTTTSPAIQTDGSYLDTSVEDDDTKQLDTKSLLSRVPIYTTTTTTTTTTSHHMRRRTATKSSWSPPAPRRQQSLSRDIGHAAAETYLVTRLSFKLLRFLGVGYRWITRLLALGFYAMLLMPGFLQVGYYYYFSSQVRRSIVYGDQPRNRLDLYLPTNRDGPKPIVIFVTGGAWIIGYKAWGSLLGRQLAERDIMVACIDYRNFPQGTISDMVKDASQAISYMCNNVVEYGGDPNKIYLMGQSAGAHVAACALVEQAIIEFSKEESISWSVSQIKAYFGLSGGYNLPNLVDHFHGRGLYRSIFLSIMEGEQSLKQFSPEILIQEPSIKDAVSNLPLVILFHGTSDYSIPSDSSKTFVDALRKVGAQAELTLYSGKTHTDLFLQKLICQTVLYGLLEFHNQLWTPKAIAKRDLTMFPPLANAFEDPLRGGKDDLFDNLVASIHADDEEALAKDAMAPPRKRLVPEILLTLARKVSPF